jgi:biotin-(acetyl-CoA carboxylase) ligase
MVAVQISENINYWYKKLKEGCCDEIDSAYFFQLFKANEWALYAKHGKQFEARIIGIGAFGQLILEERTSNISEYMFKEVEFVI